MITSIKLKLSLIGCVALLSACQNPYGYNNNHYQSYGHSGQYRNPAYAPVMRPPAPRRGINVNYETLNAFEAPLAVEFGDATLVLRGRIDTPQSYSFENEVHSNQGVIANHQVSIETQFPNRITGGVVYGGRYANVSGPSNNYSDDVAVYAGGSWGTVFGGNVSNLVFEETRRGRSVGIVQLRGNGALGGLNEWSGGYRGRFGPAIVSAAVDEDANYDVGVSFQRPIGNKDYRFTARHNNGTYLAQDGVTELDTKSVSGVAEYVYGSSRFDMGGGYERVEDADRWFAGAGISSKKGRWSVSAEGQYGQIEGQDEIAAVVGVRRDLARGLAATVSVDYVDRQVNVNGVDYLDDKDTRVTAALSYGF